MERDHDEQTTEPIMCKNNCGFCGNPANENLCSICYREHLKNQNNSSLSHYNESSSESLASEGAYGTPDTAVAEVPVSETSDILTVSGEESSVEVKQKDRNRCYQCRRMVGLLGFTCRCGFTFCSSHRQANIHNCDFDYKSFNRMQLEKRAVKVVADKLERI